MRSKVWACLHSLHQPIFEWLQLSQGGDVDDQYRQHDGELEVGINGCCKHLGSSQAQGEVEHHCVPEAQPGPACSSQKQFQEMSSLTLVACVKISYSEGFQLCSGLHSQADTGIVGLVGQEGGRGCESKTR